MNFETNRDTGPPGRGRPDATLSAGSNLTSAGATSTDISSVTGTDAEVVAPMDRAAAQRLDKRIRLMGTTMRENLVKIEALLIEAKAGQIHLTLGYKTWTGYVADALGGRMDMNTETRRAVVELLAGVGMSQRAIAGAVGVDQSTISRDQQVMHDASPEPRTADKPDRVTGLDGKQHPAKRKPVTRAKELTHLQKLQKERCRIERIISDLAWPTRAAKGICLSGLDDGITAEEARRFHEKLGPSTGFMLALYELLLKRAGDCEGADEVVEQAELSNESVAEFLRIEKRIDEADAKVAELTGTSIETVRAEAQAFMKWAIAQKDGGDR